MQATPQVPLKATEEHVVIRAADGRAYRRSVQVFFVNERGEFLICFPIGRTNTEFRQTVQGGSEPGETPTATAIRETAEEIGLDLEKAGRFIAEVLPAANFGVGASPPPVVNEAGEIVSEERAAFRYPSKTWRKQGLTGQEMYPMLYFVPSSAGKYMNVRGKNRNVRPEFRAFAWGPLRELETRAPPVKQMLMAEVCPAVAAAVAPFLQQHGIPFTGIADYLAA